MDASRQSAAKNLIDTISREHTLGGSLFGTRLELLFSNNLKILSDQLYERSTHFLLELIQNADDNTYTCEHPTLSFTYRPGILRIDCNEVGFTSDNVKAICAISQSTKIEQTSYDEYIGEKGIGFKSVFKAADIVWIASGPYTFKFDKNQPLGMITPVWAEFPEPAQTGQTSFYLQFSKDYEEKDLINELLTFDNKSIIFLRRIEIINIQITCRDGQIWKKSVQKTERWQYGDRVISLAVDNCNFKYQIQTYIVKDLPREHRRPNRPQSKISLAFPIVNFLQQPNILYQSVYAFLPIRNYGLKFLLQGDFILTASREDIENTPWNHTLRDAVAEAFLCSINHFNQGELKYVWPGYLPSLSKAASNFFTPAVASILTKLQESCVVESCAGILVEPSSVKYVSSDAFTDDEGIPFTLSPRTAPRYLSSKYPKWAFEAMADIGVSQLNFQEFLQDLKLIIDDSPENFHKRPARWHSQLAKTLLELGTNAELLHKIQDLYLIPLHDGSWTSNQGRDIFFSKNETLLEIPSGIKVSTVDSSVESDPNRRKLFMSLGVRAWETPEICRFILRTHAALDFDPKAFTPSQLISHTMFLYKASWQPPKKADLWFATKHDDRSLGRKLYIPAAHAANSAAGRLFDQLQRKFAVIHAAYLEISSPSDSDWEPWLVRNFGLSTVPRLIDPRIESLFAEQGTSECTGSGVNPLLRAPDIEWSESTISLIHSRDVNWEEAHNKSSKQKHEASVLSDEFAFMFRECHSSDVLQLLKDNWQHYSKWIVGLHKDWQNNDFRALSAELKYTLSVRRVHTAKGLLPLKDTVLPMIDPELDEECNIPALAIEKPQDAEWVFLSYFGVLVKADIHYYLRCLIALSEGHTPEVDKVAYIYEQIQANYKGNEDIINAAFSEKAIVYAIPTARSANKRSQWMSMRDCVLRGIPVENCYQSSSYLFRCLMCPWGDPIAPLLAAATSITTATRLEDITRLFRDISIALKDISTTKSAQLLRSLRDHSIFPITTSGQMQGYGNLLGVQDVSWYIADQHLIRESFIGKLPLLAVPVEELVALEDFFHVLRLDGRILSKCATSETNPSGRIEMHLVYTASLQAKTRFLKALVPQLHSDRAAINRQLNDLRVHVATQVSQVFVLEQEDTEIYGNPVRGQVAMLRNDNHIDFFLTEESINAEYPPFDLVRAIADICAFKDLSHYSLLFAVLSNYSMEGIAEAFAQQGLQVEGIIVANPKKSRKQRKDLFAMPSPFSKEVARDPGEGQGIVEATKYDGFGHRVGVEHKDNDRRAPLRNFAEDKGQGYAENAVAGHFDTLAGWDLVQYLGELLVSKLLQKLLGSSYWPERDWTSCFRHNSGHKPFEGVGTCAPFKIEESKARDLMTAFLMKHGQSETSNWANLLQVNSPVYHFEVAVSTGGQAALYIADASQVERIRQFKMQTVGGQNNKHVAVLVRISDVHSDDLSSIRFIVDPWRFLESGRIVLQGGWLLKASIQENRTGKRRKVSTPITWAESIPSLQNSSIISTPSETRHKEAFIYRSLYPGQIRLLYLVPGCDHDDLRGAIFHNPCQYDQAYQALSYAWGSTERTELLTTPEGVLPITKSLHTALQRLRHQTDAVILWVDAICINQDDNTEKAQQIRLLPKIFQMALCTYVFLEDSRDANAAIDMLMQILNEDNYGTRCLQATHEPESREPDRESGSDGTSVEMWDAEEKDSDGTTSTTPSHQSPENLPSVVATWDKRSASLLEYPIWTSIQGFFELPWFRRVWVIQEIAVSRAVKIVCGKWTIDWEDLYHATDIIDRKLQTSHSPCLNLLRKSWEPFQSIAALREWETRRYRWTLLMLLEKFRNAESTYKRDRLFALIGLASDGNEDSFKPNYDCPLETIVLSYAHGFILQGRAMQLLYSAGLNGQCSRFPSWIPDWTVNIPTGLHELSDGGRSFSAGGSYDVKVKWYPHTDELTLEGFAVDSIQSISKSSNLEQEWKTYFNEVDTMVDSLALSPTGDLQDNLKWKVPIAGVLHAKVVVSGGLDLRSSYKAFRQYFSRQSWAVEDNYHNGLDPLRTESMNYMNALQGAIVGWRYVITQRGYVGIVPGLTEVGDTVLIFKGGRVPFLVRKSMERPQAYRLVGQCYIHGIMNGEVLSELETLGNEFRLH
ncbi:uncharacterized protein BDR25DRAFT_255455 [Lindgomyces ingoldianus]|uniref:Uncharacterized protein n=1 Tax=Lindgomyces ingoldianus TaxID=673940 RepID=A0ACB6R7Z9_9PLEO|nr:uncharacterized protein BDR25DRAFT_255455 [Lindgomyces ingoldianus]KAF2474923.1 hypothetical protein BDR25DRAFT_255455 [Lindgomyces ingoldianus]